MTPLAMFWVPVVLLEERLKTCSRVIRSDSIRMERVDPDRCVSLTPVVLSCSALTPVAVLKLGRCIGEERQRSTGRVVRAARIAK